MEMGEVAGARVKSDGVVAVAEGPCKESLVLERYRIIYLENRSQVLFGNFIAH